ncbi:MAG: hypothetical protein QXU93_11625 [Thermoproteus sp.]
MYLLAERVSEIWTKIDKKPTIFYCPKYGALVGKPYGVYFAFWPLPRYRWIEAPEDFKDKLIRCAIEYLRQRITETTDPKKKRQLERKLKRLLALSPSP